MGDVQRTGLLSSKGLRRILSNISWLGVEKISQIIAAVVVGSWVARHLGPENFGMLGGAMAVVALLGPLATAGLRELVTRSLVAHPESSSSLIARAFRQRLTAACAVYAGLAAWCLWKGGENTLLLLVGILLAVQAADVFHYYFQSKTLSKYNVISSLIAIILGVAGRITGILSDAGLLYFAIWVWLQPLIRQIIVFVFMRRSLRGGSTVKKPERLEENWPWRERLPVMIGMFGALVFTKLDIVMLRAMRGDAEAGEYYAAARLTENFQILPMVLAVSLFPALMRSWQKSGTVMLDRLDRYYRFNAFCSYATVAVLVAGAGVVVSLLYGDQYVASATILRIHSFSLFASFLASVRYQFIIAEKLVGFWMVIALIGAVLNALLNIILIPPLGGQGAAWATVISYSLSAIGTSFLHPRLVGQGKMQLAALLNPFGFLRK